MLPFFLVREFFEGSSKFFVFSADIYDERYCFIVLLIGEVL